MLSKLFMPFIRSINEMIHSHPPGDLTFRERMSRVCTWRVRVRMRVGVCVSVYWLVLYKKTTWETESYRRSHLRNSFATTDRSLLFHRHELQYSEVIRPWVVSLLVSMCAFPSTIRSIRTGSLVVRLSVISGTRWSLTSDNSLELSEWMSGYFYLSIVFLSLFRKSLHKLE